MINKVIQAGGRSSVALTFISQDGHSDGEERTQHIQQSYRRLQRPFILTLGALGALLDACVKTTQYYWMGFFIYLFIYFWSSETETFDSSCTGVRPTSGQTVLESTLKSPTAPPGTSW